MAVRKDRDSWVVEFQQRGARIFRRCPPGVTKAQAEALEVRLRRDMFDRAGLGKRDDISIQGAIGLWLENNRRKNQKQALSEAKQWEPWFHRSLSEASSVAQEAVASWRKPTVPNGKLRSVVAQTSTVNRRLAMLKAVCKHAYKTGLTPENLSGRVTLLKESNRREIYLTKEQVSELARVSPTEPITSAIWLLAYSGLRASELLALGPTTSHAVTLTVATSKTGKPRQVPIAAPIRPYLSSLPLDLSYWQLRDGFDEARKGAKLPKGVTLHTLRHTCASWLINAGVDLYTVGRILGHSSPQTTARYAHLSDASLKAAMGKLK